jgi:hypothetical protein
MANYLHYSINAGNDSIVQVTLDAWANVYLLDDSNYNNYRRGLRYQYYGGYVDVSPFNIRPPHYTHWNVVIDRGGYTGTVRASVRII